jgi:hypothetical protein
MGRERKNPIQIYLSDEELKLLNERTKESGYKSKSEFLRKGIVNGGTTFIVDTDGIFERLQKISYEIHKLGVNINQIAKRANATSTVYDRDIEDIKEAQKSIWKALKQDMRAIEKLSNLV